jgi:hypothetical protein
MIRLVIQILFHFFYVLVLITSCATDDKESKKKSDLCPECKKTLDKNHHSDRLSRRDSILENYHGMKKFSHSKSITHGLYSLEIKTFYLNDTLDDDIVSKLFTRPVIQNQHLIFRKQDFIIDSFSLPVKTKEMQNYRNEIVIIPDVSIWRTYVVKGVKDAFFAIDATGLCLGNLCPEYIGIYTMEGKPLCQEYVGSRNYSSQLSKALQSYSIPDSVYYASDKEAIRIDYFWDN